MSFEDETARKLRATNRNNNNNTTRAKFFHKNILLSKANAFNGDAVGRAQPRLLCWPDGISRKPIPSPRRETPPEPRINNYARCLLTLHVERV